MPVAVTANPIEAAPGRSRQGRRALTVVIVGAVIVGGAFWQWRRERVAARALINRGQWAPARAKLERLLRLQPEDHELHLMLAEAFARDDSGPAVKQALEAVHHLSRIPDDAPQGVDARIREARLTLLVLHRPMQAQSLLKRALDVKPSAIEAHTLLWTILSLTGREDLAEPVFLRLYELGPARSRMEYLVSWYFSQIDPGRMTAGLDEHMGFRRSDDETARRIELNRLLTFRQEEPDQPVLHAAVARWFQDEGDIEQALHVLEQGLQIATAADDAFFVATMVSVLIEIGRLEEADEMFARWPAPCDGHDYWKSAGLLQAEWHRDYRAAADAYAKAIAAWPGPTDWKCQFRQAGCLALAGDEPQAAQARRRAGRVQDLFKPETQQRLRSALETPDDPIHLKTIVEFYKALGRDAEVRFWREVAGG